MRDEYVERRNPSVWPFANPRNPSEVVDILVTEDAAKIDTLVKRAVGTNIRIAAVPDLIAVEQKSGGPGIWKTSRH